jgi:hypothetical protein
MTSFNAGTGVDPTAQAAATKGTTFQAAGVPPNTAAPQLDDKTVLVELDGRKYTLADLVTKVTHADGHIKNLEAEAGEARKVISRLDELASSQVSMQEVLAKLGTAKVEHVSTAPTAAAVAASTAPSLTREDVTATVTQAIQAQRVSEQAAQNFKEVSVTLTKVYGDKTDAVVAKVAAEHGMTAETLEQLSRTAPKMVLKLFDLKEPQNPVRLDGNVNALSLGIHPTTAGQAAVKSGYWETGNSRERTSIYQQKLAEVKAKYGITG